MSMSAVPPCRLSAPAKSSVRRPFLFSVPFKVQVEGMASNRGREGEKNEEENPLKSRPFACFMKSAASPWPRRAAEPERTALTTHTLDILPVLHFHKKIGGYTEVVQGNPSAVRVAETVFMGTLE
jgi:hypothetical protein